MPGSTPLPVDLRSYSPAGVIAIDLVGHSACDQLTTMAVQRVLHDVLKCAITSLQLTDVHLNHTGDGYICTLLGNNSARILDLINILHPELLSRLAAYEQTIRAGIAFGLTHLRSNSLTGGDTHFDQPGIEASRLEQAAQPGQVLTTSTVHSIFHRHYPTMFGPEMLNISTKDREILAYALFPDETWTALLRQYLVDFIYRQATQESTTKLGSLLVVDDEPLAVMMLEELLGSMYPDRQLFTASRAEEALEIFRHRPFAMVLTDIQMPGLNGIQMIKRMRESVPTQVFVCITAYDHYAGTFFEAGGDGYVLKPFERQEFQQIVNYAMSRVETDLGIKSQLTKMCDDPIEVWDALHRVARTMDEILAIVGKGNDVAQSLLRHKAKHLINDAVSRFAPGCDPQKELLDLCTQLSCVKRLSRVIGQLGVQNVTNFVAALIEDLRKVHRTVDFKLEICGSAGKRAVRCGGVVILVVVELIDNAVAAIDQHGRIDLEVATLKAAGLMQITVKDSGPGVAENLEERLFEEGVSTKGTGRGLGLHIVRQAIHSMGGSINYSRDGGSTFCVKIPISA